MNNRRPLPARLRRERGGEDPRFTGFVDSSWGGNVEESRAPGFVEIEPIRAMSGPNELP